MKSDREKRQRVKVRGHQSDTAGYAYIYRSPIEFYELDTALLSKALRVLEAQGKAQLFSGKQTDEMGVKFF